MRNLLTDFLQTMMVRLELYAGAVPFIEEMLSQSHTRQVVDLCSGAAGPWPRLADSVSEFEVLLTDKYPNQPARLSLSREREGRIRYFAESVEASRVPPELRGVRTLFTGFHHFQPDAARAVLLDAVRSGVPIGVFEFTERSIRRCLLDLVMVAPLVLILSAFIRPVTPARILFTYVLPIVPLMVMWDGLVSNLRTYSPPELEELAASVASDGYRWQAGRVLVAGAKAPITYLVGWPAPTCPASRD